MGGQAEDLRHLSVPFRSSVLAAGGPWADGGDGEPPLVKSPFLSERIRHGQGYLLEQRKKAPPVSQGGVERRGLSP